MTYYLVKARCAYSESNHRYASFVLKAVDTTEAEQGGVALMKRKYTDHNCQTPPTYDVLSTRKVQTCVNCKFYVETQSDDDDGGLSWRGAQARCYRNPPQLTIEVGSYPSRDNYGTVQGMSTSSHESQGRPVVAPNTIACGEHRPA